MNEIFMWLWLADVVHKVTFLFFMAGMFGVVGAVIGYAVASDAWSEEREDHIKQVSKRVAIGSVVLLLITAILPSSSALKIYAVGKAGHIATTETDLGKKAVEALEVVLDKIIKEEKE